MAVANKWNTIRVLRLLVLVLFKKGRVLKEVAFN